MNQRTLELANLALMNNLQVSLNANNSIEKSGFTQMRRNPSDWNRTKSEIDYLYEKGQCSDYDITLEGDLNADGTEQMMFEKIHTEPFQAIGVVDLSNMKEGDNIIIRHYIKVKSNGEYRKYAEEIYELPLDNPLLYVEMKVAMHGMKVTIQQISGVNKEYSYQWFIAD